MTTREKILATARREFARRGLEGARVDRIARDAGVNKAMIYYHFDSKDALYQAVIEDLFAHVGDVVRDAFETEPDLEGLFAEVARRYVTLFDSSDELAPIVLREMAAGGDRIRDALGAVIAEVGATRRIRQLFAKGVRSGSLRRLNATQAAVSFIGMNLFYLFFSPVLDSIWEIRDVDRFRRSRPRAVADLFLDGVRSR